MSKNLSISVIVLTRNEAVHLERLLSNLEQLDCQIYVVDSFSTDATVTLALSRGAFVKQHVFVNQGQQLQWALDNLPIETEWIMLLAACEIITPELIAEIGQKLSMLPLDVTGINLKRRYIFMGQLIRHGGRDPLALLRIWRKRAAKIKQRWLAADILLMHGRAVTFDHNFSDYNLNDLSFFANIHNDYATREAIDVLNKRYSLFPSDGSLSASSASVHAATKRFIKERVYNHLPFWLGPLGYFLYRYFLRLGFLDGRAGLIYHFLQGFWYRFLVGAKVVEYDTVLATCADNTTRLAELERLTGHNLTESRARPQGAPTG